MTEERWCVCEHPEDSHDDNGMCLLCRCVTFREAYDFEEDEETEELDFDDHAA